MHVTRAMSSTCPRHTTKNTFKNTHIFLAKKRMVGVPLLSEVFWGELSGEEEQWVPQIGAQFSSGGIGYRGGRKNGGQWTGGLTDRRYLLLYVLYLTGALRSLNTILFLL